MLENIKQFEITDILTLLSSNIPALFYYVDTNLRYKFANEHFKTIHELDPEKMIGLHIKDVIGEQGFQNASPYYEQVLSGKRVSYQSYFKTRIGTQHHFKATYIPHIISNKTIGFAGFITDITELTKQQQSREEVYRLLSHDIRVPLTSIVSLIDYSKDKPTILDEIKSLTHKCMKYADDFLNLSEVSNTANNISFDSIDLIRALEDSVDIVIPTASKYDVEIILDSSIPEMFIHGNYFILQRIFINLLDNAIKYSDPNKTSIIRITLEQNENSLIIQFYDNGLGLSEKHQTTIIKGFLGGSTSYYNRFFGLGLRYVSVASKLHKAKITINSKLTKYSKISLTIPLNS